MTDFSGKDDLLFPNLSGNYNNHDDMVKRKFLPLFALLEAKWEDERRNEAVEYFNWHLPSGISRFRAGLTLAFRQRPFRPSQAIRACK
ncbi:hypothetical protein [Bradyrhizobium sp. OK095]|uniref:hypothetical protein n=1 Tax=Bradyrhizobium sp. OK095 TaxID=1882760 RepID=UPI0008CBE2EB|nr:hypothetical protein [Bradyrhizobium sp. OK095]SEN88260.1 hypothetical protein SAMN05443254_1137 [Bradyrhizobium sp. OK095]